MGIIAAWNALLGVENKGWKKGFTEAREEVGKTDRTYKDFLKSIKGGLGKSSALGQTLKLAAGGGAIAGLGLVTREFASFGEEIGKLSDGFRDGSVSQREFMNQVAFGIPLVGNLARGFAGIEEAFTHEKGAMAEADAAWKKHWDVIARSSELEREHAKALRESTQAFVESAEHRSHLADAAGLKGASRDVAEENERVRVEAQKLASDADKALTAAGLDPDSIKNLKIGADNFQRARSQGRDENTLAGLKGGNDAYEKAMADRAKIITAYQQDEQAMWRTHDAEVARIKQEDAEKQHHANEEQDRNARHALRQAVMDNLEDEKKQLEETIHEDEHLGTSRSADTQNVRGTLFAMYQPTVNNPQHEAALQAVEQLKAVNKHLEELKRQDDAVQAVQMGG